jgi:hypothetical protein
MERPKSSKYNFGRRKTTFFKTETPSCMVNEVEINVVPINDEKLIDDIDSNDIRSKNLKKQRVRNERHMQIKSAYPTFQSQLRPQSARHNLDKYRQDALLESKQAKSALKNVSNQAKFIDLMDNNELDELDYLYIREEDSTTSENELDTQNKKPIDAQHIRKQKKYSKLKLLKQRQDVGEAPNVNRQNLSSNNNNNNNNNNIAITSTTTTTATTTPTNTTNNAKNSSIDLTKMYNRSNTVSILKNPLQQQTLNEQQQQNQHQPHQLYQQNTLKTSTSNLNKDLLRHQARINQYQQQTVNNNNQNIPWLTRNRDFSAHKVLLKHRAELEEITLKNSANFVNTKNMFLTEKFLRK